MRWPRLAAFRTDSQPTTASAGNVCTVRCRNAQEFGGCVAVQQTDITPLAGDNPPSNITSAQTLAQIQAQIQENQKDLPAAIAGNQAAATVDQQGVKIAQAILDSEPAIVAAVQNELKTKAAAAQTAAATTAPSAGGNTNTGKKGANGNAAKGNKNGGNGNAAAAAGAGGAGKGNGNNAAGKGSAANAAAQAAKGNNNNNNNNNKRETPAQRRARYVQAGAAFSEDTGN